MKPVSPELVALLATRQFLGADIYTITLADGTVLRYCGGDQDLTVNGLLFTAGGQTGPYFDRKENKATCHQKLGLQADTLTVDVIPGTAQVLGAPFLTAVQAGTFDGAEVLLEKVFMPTWGDTRRGTVRWFLGRIAEIDGGRSVLTMVVNSHLELLNQQMPRNLVQVGCVNNLGDGTCGVNLASYMTTGSILSGSTQMGLNASITARGGVSDASVYNQGTIGFTSGALNGLSATVRAAVFGSPSTIGMLGPLPSAPAAGDTFNLYFGCNKSLTDGNGCPKFGNTARFRGFPFVPQPATAA